MPKKIISTEWEDNYNSLCTFVDENNRLPEFRNDNTEESKLGNWLRRMRSEKNRMCDIKINKLQSVKGWYWNIEELNEKKWNENYEKIKTYYEKGLVPIKSSKDEEEKKLAEWCVTQRKTYKNKKISDKKIYMLEQIENWNWGFSQEVLWNEKFEKVKSFFEKEKRFPQHIRKDDNYNELLLAYWCDDNRKNKNISNERYEKLKSIGFYN